MHRSRGLPETMPIADTRSADPSLKAQIQDFWNDAPCGEAYTVGESSLEKMATHARTRYEPEPYIRDFARFGEGRDRDVLEIGVGMGADHLEWARSAPRSLSGVDLTARAIEDTKTRLALNGVQSTLKSADAENLPFPNNSFYIVYSWGVLHHTPDTPRAFREVYRVLRSGGTGRIMIYHRWSLTGYMLWVRYACLTARWDRSLDDVYAEHLESPGTKAYSVAETEEMCAAFSKAKIWTGSSFGDLLIGQVGQRHRGLLLSVVKRIWPRSLIRRLFARHGLLLYIEVVK